MLSAITTYRDAVSFYIEHILAAPPPFSLYDPISPYEPSRPHTQTPPSPTPASPPLSHTLLSQTPQNFLAPAQALARGGKRTRALFALAGWQAGINISADALDHYPTERMPIGLGAALELYQLSALIHDDVIDEASTRRGVPTAHETFAQTHRQHNLLGDPHEYGTKMALLLGDYVLSLAAYTLEKSLSTYNFTIPASAQQVRRLFHSMTTEVAFGQYIDVHAEFTAIHNCAEENCTDENCTDEAITSALSVLHHKAARYSVTVPTLLGALLGEANPLSSSLTDELKQICSPLGEAFQLRDDVLGVFGSPEMTGKPAGDDISEGKRTVLLALTRKRASAEDRDFIDSHLGRPLEGASLQKIQRIIKECGAYSEHEEMIARRERYARQAMSESEYPLDVLMHIADQLSGRTA